MRRRDFVFASGAALVRPLAAAAQEPGRSYRVFGASSNPRNAPMSKIEALNRHKKDPRAI
jgi:hypothetical protein